MLYCFFNTTVDHRHLVSMIQKHFKTVMVKLSFALGNLILYVRYMHCLDANNLHGFEASQISVFKVPITTRNSVFSFLLGHLAMYMVVDK